MANQKPQIVLGRIGEYHRDKRLLLDFDVTTPCPSLASIHRILRDVGLRTKAISFTRSRRGWHVVMYLGISLTHAESIALQALCGSDPKREILNLSRAISMRLHGSTPGQRRRFNILFSEKVIL